MNRVGKPSWNTKTEIEKKKFKQFRPCWDGFTDTHTHTVYAVKQWGSLKRAPNSLPFQDFCNSFDVLLCMYWRMLFVLTTGEWECVLVSLQILRNDTAGSFTCRLLHLNVSRIFFRRSNMSRLHKISVSTNHFSFQPQSRTCSKNIWHWPTYLSLQSFHKAI